MEGWQNYWGMGGLVIPTEREFECTRSAFISRRSRNIGERTSHRKLQTPRSRPGDAHEHRCRAARPLRTPDGGDDGGACQTRLGCPSLVPDCGVPEKGPGQSGAGCPRERTRTDPSSGSIRMDLRMLLERDGGLCHPQIIFRPGPNPVARLSSFRRLGELCSIGPGSRKLPIARSCCGESSGIESVRCGPPNIPSRLYSLAGTRTSRCAKRGSPALVTPTLFHEMHRYRLLFDFPISPTR